MVDSTHNLNLVWTQTGLNEVESSMNKFANTSGLVTKSQDALANAMGKTEGAAFKTGKEFTKTEDAMSDTQRQTTTLGQAFKSSALQITAFASGLISTIGQVLSYQKATTSLEKAQATLNARWISLEQAEKKLAAQIQEGSISQSDAALQSEKLAAKRQILEKQTELLEQKEQAHTLSLVNLATTAIPTVINGISSLTNIYNSVKGTIDAATESTNAASESTETLGTTADIATTSSIIPLIKNFTSWITGAKDVSKSTDTLTGAVKFAGDEIGKTEKSGNILIRAFQNMGAGITGFGTTLKAAGKSVLEFGRTLLTTFISNPILLAITAISAAVLALITNFGGFRDAVNGVGVAIGNAIPGLKGFLDWFGQSANAALDTAASFLGVETNAQRLEKQAAATAAVIQNKLVVALNDFLNIGSKAENLDYVIAQFDQMRSSIGKLTVETEAWSSKSIVGIKQVGTEWEDVKATFVNASPEVKQAMNEVDEVIKIVTSDSFLLAHGANAAEVAQHLLTQVLDKFGDTAGQKSAPAAEELASANEQIGITADEARKAIQSQLALIKTGEQDYQHFAMAVAAGNYDMAASIAGSKEEFDALLERFTKDFPNGAKLVIQGGKVVVEGITEVKDTLMEARDAIYVYNREQDYLKEVSNLVASGIIKDSKLWENAIQKLIDKYPELGKTVDDVLKDTINAEEKQEKATAKANKEVDKAILKAENLAQTRLKGIEAENMMTTAAADLATELGVQIRVTDLTGKGLQDLIKLYDETGNATGIAADSVAVWYAELERNTTVETETVAKLRELATNLNITIPEAILQGGVPAIKTFIEEMTGMGEGAKKVKQELLSEFESMKTEVQSVLDGMISDKLGEDGDDVKKVLKGVKKMDLAVNSFAVEPRLIRIFLDDKNFDNDLVGLNELMAQNMDRMGDISVEGAKKIGDGLMDSVGDSRGKEQEEV